ncbi:hypothetical protein CJF30_00005386 [Rutstroemia sp. NJR-2017a BBW]|nr:hypothetical protein CJF30_00005386 [Rutstroemia sp. NJR-2017a BBW]
MSSGGVAIRSISWTSFKNEYSTCIPKQKRRGQRLWFESYNEPHYTLVAAFGLDSFYDFFYDIIKLPLQLGDTGTRTFGDERAKCPCGCDEQHH